MATIGPLARSVADLGLALTVLAGSDGRHWEVPPVGIEPVPSVDHRHLRVAWTDNFGDVPVTADTRQALASFARMLEGLGTHVEQRRPDGFDVASAWETWGELFQAEVGSSMAPEEKVSMATANGVSADAASPEERGRARTVNATMRQFVAALNRRDELIGALEGFFETCDVWLCPTSSTPAIPHCVPGTPISVDGRAVDYRVAGLAYCSPFNVTGHPVVVIPLARSAEGLPIGVQLVGPRWGEARLLGIAAMLSEAVGLGSRPPGV